MTDSAIDFNAYPRELKETWAIYEVLRRLGYSPDDLYITDKIAPTPEALSRGVGYLGVLLKYKGNEARMWAGPPPADWGPMIQAMMSAPELVMQRIWDASRAKAESANILTMLTMKGMYPL